MLGAVWDTNEEPLALPWGHFSVVGGARPSCFTKANRKGLSVSMSHWEDVGAFESVI